MSSVDNRAWLVKANGDVYYRTNTSLSNPVGTEWLYVPGLRLKFITVGESGVWGLTEDGHVYYRRNTSRLDGYDQSGSDWVQVSGVLSSLASGNGIVWATTIIHSIYIRIGICFETPSGTSWVKMNGMLSQLSIDSVNNAVWGTQSHGNIYKRDYD